MTIFKTKAALLYDKVDDEGTAQSGEEAVPEEEAPAEAAVLSESAEV